jgi:hypothetical protein
LKLHGERRRRIGERPRLVESGPDRFGVALAVLFAGRRV